MSIIKKFLAGGLLALALFAFVSAVPASAQSLLAPTCGGSTGNPCPIIGDTRINGSASGLSNIILTVARFAVYILGAVAVLFLVYGGFLYVTDQGDGANAKKGGAIFRSAVVGLILAIAAFAIVNVIGSLVSGNLLQGISQ
jgi:hypothetical protein